MTAPPPEDDPTILNDADLWRRIFPGWWLRDKGSGAYRLSSAAFDDSPDKTPMSVTIATEAPGYHILLDGHVGYGLLAITAGLARQNRQILVRDPRPENPAHAHVVGKKTGSVKDALRVGARILVEPVPKT